MKVKTLLSFLVILAILVGVVVWQKMNVKPPMPLATQIGLENLVADGIQKNTIQRIELFAGAEPDEKVVLERQQDSWSIASLFDAPGNTETVDKFVDQLLSLKGEPRATADTEAKLADYDLSEDKAFHVQAFKADEEAPVVNILFGKTADYRTIFLRKADDNRIFVEAINLKRDAGVSEDAGDTVPKQEKWLQTKLVELVTDKITKLQINYPDKQLTLAREEVPAEPETEEGEETEVIPPSPTYKWILAQGGFTKEFKESEVTNLLSRFKTVLVNNVADPARKAEIGFESPLFSITVSQDDAEDLVLLGGQDKEGGDCYIQRIGSDPELIYAISKFNFEQLFLQGSKLFTLPEWTVDEDALQSIAITTPRDQVALSKDGGEWIVKEPRLSLEVQKTALDNLVSAIASLKAVDYADADKELGAFDTTITLTLSDGSSRTLHIGQPSQTMDGRYIKFDDSDAVLTISQADAEKLMPPVRDLFVLSVLDFDVQTVTALEASGEGTKLALSKPEDALNWTGSFNGTAIEPSPDAVNALLFDLNDFQVSNFLLNRDLDAVSAIGTLSLHFGDDSETVIKIGPEQNGSHELVISGLPYLFTADVSAIQEIIAAVEAFESMTPTPAEEESPAAEETASDASEAVVSPEDVADDAESLVIPEDVVETVESVVVPDDVAETVESVVVPDDVAETVESVVVPEDAAETVESVVIPEDAAETVKSVVIPEDAAETVESVVIPEDVAETVESVVIPDDAADAAIAVPAESIVIDTDSSAPAVEVPAE